MRIFESMVKYLLFIVLVFSSCFILFAQLGNIPDKLVGYVPVVNEYINGYTLLVCLLFSAAFGFISPMYDVGKYLNTQNIEEISRFKRREQQKFGMLAFGFIADIFLCGKVFSFLWYIGAFLLTYVSFLLLESIVKKRRLEKAKVN